MTKGFEYLTRRGVSEESIIHFGLMYYADEQLHAKLGRFSPEFIKHVKSLLNPERFNDCVIYPIIDLHGKLASISARRLDGQPKYDSLPFNKKSLLYGLNDTYSHILNRNMVFVVEGVFDLIMMWQYGIRNVVCSLGCTLTYEQMCLAGRFTNHFTIVYDPDTAGIAGMSKASKLLTKHEYLCKTISIPGGLDIDDYLLKYGAEDFLNHAKNSRTVQTATRSDVV